MAEQKLTEAVRKQTNYLSGLPKIQTLQDRDYLSAHFVKGGIVVSMGSQSNVAVSHEELADFQRYTCPA